MISNETLKILFFDTETTGLPLVDSAALDQQPRIIEIAAALFDNLSHRQLGTLDILINPGVNLETVIRNITGLTDFDLRDKEPWAAQWEIVQAFF